MSLFISGFWQVVASGGVAGEETLSEGHMDQPEKYVLLFERGSSLPHVRPALERWRPSRGLRLKSSVWKGGGRGLVPAPHVWGWGLCSCDRPRSHPGA